MKYIKFFLAVVVTVIATFGAPMSAKAEESCKSPLGLDLLRVSYVTGWIVDVGDQETLSKTYEGVFSIYHCIVKGFGGKKIYLREDFYGYSLPEKVVSRSLVLVYGSEEGSRKLYLLDKELPAQIFYGPNIRQSQNEVAKTMNLPSIEEIVKMGDYARPRKWEVVTRFWPLTESQFNELKGFIEVYSEYR